MLSDYNSGSCSVLLGIHHLVQCLLEANVLQVLLKDELLQQIDLLGLKVNLLVLGVNLLVLGISGLSKLLISGNLSI